MRKRLYGIFVLGCTVVAIVCSIPKSASGLSPDDLGASIPSKGQVVMLRNNYCGKELKFDVQGKLISKGQTGPWTLCRDIRIEQVKLENGKLRIEGWRAFLFYDQEQKQFRDVYEANREGKCSKQKVDITLELPPGADDTNIQSAMNLLFYSSPQEVLATASEAWRSFMQAEFNRHGQSATSSGPIAGAASSAVDAKTSSSTDGEDSPIFLVRKGVTAPISVHTPDPSYTNPARCFRVQGTVLLSVIIGTDGLVHRPVVKRALGMGLDESAIVTVLGWKFKPATKDGKPVAVLVNVEVSYNLY